MEEKINAVHESLEERYIDFIDTNAVMVKTDSDLGQRINAVEEVVLDMEDVQNKNNQSLVTPEMLGNLNRAFQESIDFLTVKMTIGTGGMSSNRGGQNGVTSKNVNRARL